MLTGLEQISGTANIKRLSAVPTSPQDYYGASYVDNVWVGGEIFLLTTDNRVYIQNATSGTTPEWLRLVTQLATSTSTSTSTSTTSSSTSSSSTTTAA